jgi:hypothetical protein
VARTPAEEIEVGPGRPNLEFRYAGLSLSAPEHVTFRYRLEGFDPDWVEAGTRRVAYYPRLPPGKYRFTVTAANRDGVWNPDGTGLRLRWSLHGRGWFRQPVLDWSQLQRRGRLSAHPAPTARENSPALIESQEHGSSGFGELHDPLGQDLLVVKNRAHRLGMTSFPTVRQLEQISDVASQALEGVGWRILTRIARSPGLSHPANHGESVAGTTDAVRRGRGHDGLPRTVRSSTVSSGSPQQRGPD